ncbi:MAG: hypothetical protein DHS20C09_13220 [marine bacterium B5-7]|nr:MAG: hypothetical protein DHS20C09_13220 [marine bacterium B5-7]
MTSLVLNPWMESMTWKEQTVLLTALRGPDIGGTAEVKLMVRWIRSIVLRNAAPSKTFMRETNFKSVQDIAEEKPLAFDMLPIHYITHLMHAFQVIGVRHPEPSISTRAKHVYEDFCIYLHTNPETDSEMTLRLQDEIV